MTRVILKNNDLINYGGKWFVNPPLNESSPLYSVYVLQEVGGGGGHKARRPRPWARSSRRQSAFPH